MFTTVFNYLFLFIFLFVNFMYSMLEKSMVIKEIKKRVNIIQGWK